jgi:serine/threonine protein kinase
MPLSPGVRLGPYEILDAIGAGGMGEVYRARDIRLERTVAIKILPAHLSSGPVRKQRFEREAKIISSLNHPHICVLHDVGQQDGIDYLVMECVEGETLARRLEKGALPLDQVLKLGTQIADALDKAHRSGVVHRDLKPANIMLTATGVKLLDFGLAKPSAPLASLATLTAAATQTTPVTEPGTIVGTFQYMSPEQVEGKELDGRSDIFSLGAVLYEMVTGRRAFQGRSQLSVASTILEKEPAPISTIKPMTPPALDHAIRRCLAKDPHERWQSARDLELELKWVADEGSRIGVQAPVTSHSTMRERLLLAALAVSALVAVAMGVLYARRAPMEARVARAYIKPMANSSFNLSSSGGFALSPDGRSLAYVATTSDEKSVLWIRPIDSLQAQPLAGTEGAAYPFWSPDSRSIGFFAFGKLKKIESSGGPPLTLCDAPEGRGGTWNPEGDILFTPSVTSPIYRVSMSGGPTTPVTTLDSSKNETTHRWPDFLPDGRHFLYLTGNLYTPTENPTNAILVGSLDSQESKLLVRTYASAIYASGHLLFLRQHALMAQPLDVKRLEFTGEARAIVEPIQEEGIVGRGRGGFSASDNGLLTYLEGTGGTDRQLVWIDRSGKRVGEVPGADAYAGPRISPDGKKIVFELNSAGADIWSYDMGRGIKTKLTFGSASAQGNRFAVWSPDGRRIAYTSYRNGKYGIFQKASDGSGVEEVLLEASDRIKFLSDWSPDGKVLTYHEGAPFGWAIWILALSGERKPYPFIHSQFSEREPTFSPNGRWLAFCSNESSEYKVYVVPFLDPAGKWQVLSGAGCTPRWRRDGKEIFYRTPDNKLMAAEVNAVGSSFTVGAVRPLFGDHPNGAPEGYDVSADGQRFVIPFEPGQPNAAITLVINWTAELKK